MDFLLIFLVLLLLVNLLIEFYKYIQHNFTFHYHHYD